MNSERMRSLELPGDGQPIAPTAYAETPVIAKINECDGVDICYFVWAAEHSRMSAERRIEHYDALAERTRCAIERGFWRDEARRARHEAARAGRP